MHKCVLDAISVIINCACCQGKAEGERQRVRQCERDLCVIPFDLPFCPCLELRHRQYPVATIQPSCGTCI